MRPDRVAVIRTKHRGLLKALAGVAFSLTSGALAACSPYAFSDDVQTLSTKMSSVDASYQSTSQNITAEQRLNLHLGWIVSRPTLKASSGCDINATGNATCDVVVNNGVTQPPAPRMPSKYVIPATNVCDAAPASTGAPAAAAEPAKPLMPADLLKALDKYTAALAALTKAQDRTDFDNAAAKLDSAVGTLAAAASPAAGPIAKASLNVLFWLVGQGLDYQRLEELRIATRAACEPIHTLSVALGETLRNQRNDRLDGLANILALRIKVANTIGAARQSTDQAYGTAIDDAQTAADAFQAVRVSDPVAAAQALSDAHDALVIAVRSNDGELKALIASLETFAQQASDLATAAGAGPSAGAGAGTSAKKPTSAK
jgi:hypothetical protein